MPRTSRERGAIDGREFFRQFAKTLEEGIPGVTARETPRMVKRHKNGQKAAERPEIAGSPHRGSGGTEFTLCGAERRMTGGPSPDQHEHVLTTTSRRATFPKRPRTYEALAEHAGGDRRRGAPLNCGSPPVEICEFFCRLPLHAFERFLEARARPSWPAARAITRRDCSFLVQEEYPVLGIPTVRKRA
jgi:hypothetical protein